jgi:hypothetical protein
MDLTITRRRLVQTLVWCLGTLGIKLWDSGAGGLQPHEESAQLAETLRSFLPHARSAAQIGREYLRLRPSEGDVTCLLNWLCSPALRDGRSSATANHRLLAEMVRRNQEEDFKEGRVVLIQRWMISETEARLCALVALSRGSVAERDHSGPPGIS